MGKLLVIAEKPSVARDIAAALGGFTDNDEYLESDDYIVTFAVGHLLELAEPQEYDAKYKSWAIKNLPIIPDHFQINPREGQKKRLDAIKKLGHRKDVKGMINACDAGREGELIYRRIAEHCDLEKLPQQRLWLQSMTKPAIREAFAHLKPGKDLDRLGDAAWCRAVGDWLVGMNATRALTQRLKNRADKEPWSAGRVQTPTLNLLVARERQILAHIPRPYWEIHGKFKHEAQEWEARFYDPEPRGPKSEDEDEEADAEAKPSRIFDKERVDRLMKALSVAKTGDASEKRKKSRQSPPLPFDLTLLQREANRKFSFSAKRTLDAAQRLYEGEKLITYPRTDSRYLPGDYKDTIQTVLQGLARATDWKELAPEIAANPQNLDKILDDTKVSDHFAIVPTGNVPEGPMRGDDERIFELIVRQFLASMMGPATWSNVERIVTVPAGTEQARFRATSRTLEDPAFFRALGIPTEANPLPALVPGKDEAQGIVAKVIEIVEEAKETKPPSRYSEAQMLRMMETAGERVEDDALMDAMQGRGLGTPATRAETIEGLVRKNYARRVDNKLGPTSKAMRLMDVLERVNVGALASPKLTGEWEHALGQVEKGQIKRKAFLDRLVSFTKDMTGTLSTFEHVDLYAKEPALGRCPACGKGDVIESTWGYRCTRNDGENAECMFMIWKDRAGRYVDRTLVQTLLRDKKAGPLGGFVDRSGRSLTGTVFLEADTDPEKAGKWILRMDWGNGGGGDTGPEVQAGVICKCPIHPDCEIIETNRRFVCKKVLEATEKTGPLLPKVVCQREITVEEALKFFGADGRTELIDNFISKRGRPFRGWLFRRETGRYGFQFPQRGGDPANPVPQTEEEAKAFGKGRGRPTGKAKGKAKGDDAKVSAKGAKSKGKGAKAAGKATKASKAAGKGAKAAEAVEKSAGKGAKAAAKSTKAAGKGAKATKTAPKAGKGKAAKAEKAAEKGAKAPIRRTKAAEAPVP